MIFHPAWVLGFFCIFGQHWKLDPNEAGNAKKFQFILKRKNVTTQWSAQPGGGKQKVKLGCKAAGTLNLRLMETEWWWAAIWQTCSIMYILEQVCRWAGEVRSRRMAGTPTKQGCELKHRKSLCKRQRADCKCDSRLLSLGAGDTEKAVLFLSVLLWWCYFSLLCIVCLMQQIQATSCISINININMDDMKLYIKFRRIGYRFWIWLQYHLSCHDDFQLLEPR